MVAFLALAYLVALSGPASADPISALILSTIGLTSASVGATAFAVISAATTIALSTAVSLGLNALTSKFFSPKAKKQTPTNLDSSINVTAREALAPRRIIYGQTRLGGTIVYISSTDNNLFLHVVIALCEGPIQAVDSVYFNEELLVIDPSNGWVMSGNYNKNGNPYAIIFPHLGEPDQAADPTLVALDPAWTAEHRLRGVAYLYVRLQWDSTVFTTGMPNITAVVRGRRDIYDPRTGLTGYTDNAALCIRHFLLYPHRKGGVGAAPSEIDDDNFAAQANICGENVSLAAGGVESRYTINGVIQLGSQNAPQSTIESMLTACAGDMVYAAGQFVLTVGTWRTPTFAITEDMLAGPITLQTRQTMQSQFNAIKGSFVNPAARYEAADYPALTSTVFEDEDGGDQIFEDLPLEFTTSSTRAQRIAKIALFRSREPIELSLSCNLSAYEVTVGDVVTFSRARYGWVNKPFEVRSWNWKVQTKNDVPVITIELSLREISSAVFDWNATEEQLLAAQPATSLPAWGEVDAVTNLRAVAGSDELIISNDGTIISRIKVTWGASANAFVERYEVRWKLTTDTFFGNPAVVGVSTDPTYYISPVVDGATYVVEVRPLTTTGSTSETWSTTTVFVVGKTEPPADVASINIANGILTWAYPNPPADLAGYRVRYTSGSNVFWPIGTDVVAGLLTVNTLDVNSLLNGQVTIMVKAVDTSGNESVNPAVVITDFGDPIVSNVVVDYDLRAAGFPGTIVSGTVSGGNLVGPSVAPYWNANEDTPAYPQNTTLFWPTDTFGAVEWRFSYTPDASVTDATMLIFSEIQGNFWTISFREIDSSLYYETLDSVPFWSSNSDAFYVDTPVDWQSWPGSVAPLRRTTYEFLVQIPGGPLQPVISEFRLVLDVKDVIDVIGDVVVSPAGTLLPLTKTFRVITAVSLTVQSGPNGAVSARIDSKSPSGVLVTALNSSGVPVTAVLDAIVQGY